MTAFARQETRGDWGVLTCEIRTVNHRYLEPAFRLPDCLRELENDFREQLRKQLKRGKVDVSLRLQASDQAQHKFAIDEPLTKALNDAAKRISRILDNPAHISALDILRWPGVMATPEQDYTEAKASATNLFEQTINELVAARTREGERLLAILEQRLVAIHAHVAEVRDTLASDDAVGRRLDFLMQELNREANTLSSKSIDAGLTRAAVDLKVWVEQLREQVQNIE
jgi:uncharacterized protein (TIGR00255 family)